MFNFLESQDDDDHQDKYIPFKKPSPACNFIKPDNKIHDLFDMIQNELVKYQTGYPINKKPRKELQLLKSTKEKYPSIIFKASDKNLGLCAMNLTSYDAMVMEHLNNPETYSFVSGDTLSNNRLQARLEKHMNYFIENNENWYTHERKFLRDFVKHTKINFPNFYCLPKLHKEGALKGRPIAGAVSWISTPISRILNYRLEPHLIKYDSILKNSQQLVKELEILNENMPQEPLLLITGDIQSLYPNIDLTLLRKICIEEDFELEYLVDFVLDNSYVKYNNKVYKQKDGIPMGTNAAVHLANLYLAKLLDPYLSSRPQTFFYRRYIDDVFILWKGTIEQWNRCKSNINKLHPKLKIFDWTESSKTATFLDIDVLLYNNGFRTSVYQKELNKYFYLSPKSCHAAHTFSGFVSGELTRYARLSTHCFAYEQTKKLFYQRLLNRGYSRLYLNRIFRRHKWSIRENPKTRTERTLLPFVIPFTKRRNFEVVEKLFKDIRFAFEDYIPNSEVLLVYSKTQNTLELTSSSALTTEQMKVLAETTTRPTVLKREESGGEVDGGREREVVQPSHSAFENKSAPRLSENTTKLTKKKRKIDKSQPKISDYFKRPKKF